MKAKLKDLYMKTKLKDVYFSPQIKKLQVGNPQKGRWRSM